jgi:hypothetical protein
MAALGLQRWGAAGPAGVLVLTASGIAGLSEHRRAAMVSDAAYAFRVAARFPEAVKAYETAVPLLDESGDDYLRVVVRVNLAEALRGPTASQRAADLMQEALRIAGTDSRQLAAFWRNAAAMFGRLGDEAREEAALHALLPFLADCPPATQQSAPARLLEIGRSRIRIRPLTGEEAVRYHPAAQRN